MTLTPCSSVLGDYQEAVGWAGYWDSLGGDFALPASGAEVMLMSAENEHRYPACCPRGKHFLQ